MGLSDLGDAELLKIATPIMDNLMDASTHIDYERHVRDFSERAKASLDEANFRRICEHYQRERGYFADRALLGILRRPGSVIVVWKQTFTKAPGEYLAELVLAEHGGSPLIERVVVI
jgi:hypothetical protein